ncbi:putative phage tail protein [Anaerotignum sp.]|uniref:putative phage tail protein n=1 Tax=Anaerotignum sp. TaxID=2039241 RepID=UPI003735AA25
MWQLDTDLLRYLPYWFRRILDFQEICKTESAQMEALAAAINAVADNFFFQTMDEGAVSTWEKIFGIVPNPQTETLDFRRQRVLNRVSMQPPFTLGFLYQKLDQIIGKGKYEIHVDYPNYTLYILSSAENQSYATEVSYTVGRIKPAHIVFINQPFVANKLTLGETVALSALVWQYRLGSWGLGLTPFVLTEDKEVVVVPSNYSVQQELLVDTAKAIPPNVASARINGSIVISSLDRTTVGNVAQVQYTVTAEQTSLVTQIELLDSDGNVLTTSPVYVPVTEPAIFTHKIQVDVKEG